MMFTVDHPRNPRTTKLTANKTKLTSGKTYYFRARAYKMVGSAKVYTGYSAVKSVKVK